MRAAIPGEQLRQWLATAGMTHAELARRLHVDAGQVSRWCTEKAPLGGKYASNIVALLREQGLEVELPPPGACVLLYACPRRLRGGPRGRKHGL